MLFDASVSVVICAYTEARWDDLQAAVSSVQQQSLLPRELVVVVDHNQALLQRALAEMPTVTVLENQEAPGLSGARNTGVWAASGALIAFLDDDAVAEPDWLQLLAQACENPDVLGCGGLVEPTWRAGQPTWFPEEFHWVVGCSYRGLPRTRSAVRNLIGSSMCIRREVFESIGGFRSDVGRVGKHPVGCEETELCLRALQRWPERMFLYEPAARIRHAVPDNRTHWSYFCSRCFFEGRSKARVAQLTGARDGLASERSYTARALPQGLARNAMQVLTQRDVAGGARAGAIVAGLAITTAGYLSGLLRQLPEEREARPRRQYAPAHLSAAGSLPSARQRPHGEKTTTSGTPPRRPFVVAPRASAPTPHGTTRRANRRHDAHDRISADPGGGHRGGGNRAGDHSNGQRRNRASGHPDRQRAAEGGRLGEAAATSRAAVAVHGSQGVRRWNPQAFLRLISPPLRAELVRTAPVVLIAVCALILWSASLQWVNVGAMTDLGLVSVLPASCIIALVGLTLGFCLALGVPMRARSWVLLFYLLALIFMLYATPALVEQAPRFQVTYWLAGHTEYLLRTGTVDPFLDAYFNWPGFFVLTGLLTKLTGVQSVLAFAPWTSFAYNLLFLGPMYLIYSTATRDRRLIWLGLWIFFITDWVWQDYFAPQGLNFFFYLVIFAILLKWFKTTPALANGGAPLIMARMRSTAARVPTRVRGLGATLATRTTWSRAWARVRRMRPAHVWRHGISPRLRRWMAWNGTAWGRIRRMRPAQPWHHKERLSPLVRRLGKWAALSDAPSTPEQHRQRIGLLAILLAVFALSVFSHPITPLFVLLSVTALTVFRRSTPRWLPLVLAALILGWDFTAAAPYMAGHLTSDLAQIGDIHVVATTNVTDRLATGSAEHHFITQARVATTALVWGLALLGAALRWRRHPAGHAGGSAQGTRSLFSHDVPFLLLAVAPGVLVLAQPYGGEMVMRYYLFSLPMVSFFAASAFRAPVAGRLSRPLAAAAPAATAVACLLLLAGFLFARYGNERADYITYNEINAVAEVYRIAPPHSLLLQGWTGTPWRYQDLEQYDYFPLYPGYSDAGAIQAHYIGGIVNVASRTEYPAAFVIFTRSQKAQAQMFYGVPPSALDGVEDALLRSGKFVLVYRNADADVLRYVPPQQRTGASEPHAPSAPPKRGAVS